MPRREREATDLRIEILPPLEAAGLEVGEITTGVLKVCQIG
jgi:hypothetical protein